MSAMSSSPAASPSTGPPPAPAPPYQLTSAAGRTLLGHLLRYPLCVHCILRFCDVRNSHVYTKLPLPTLLSFITALHPSYSPPPLCFLCLNVLPSLASHVASLLVSPAFLAYTFSSYTLTVSLPLTATLRHLALTAHLDALLSRTTPLPSLDLKEAVKVLSISHLSSLTPHPHLSTSPPADLTVLLHFSSPTSTPEAALIEAHTEGLEHRRSKKRFKADDLLTMVNLLKAIPKFSPTELRDLLPSYTETSEGADGGVLTLLPHTAPAEFSFVMKRPPVMIMGCYLKHSRALSQTPWTIDSDDPPPLPLDVLEAAETPDPLDPDRTPSPTPLPTSSSTPLPTAASSPVFRPRARVNITATSVEEELTRHILPAFGAVSARFSSSGREDLDVRMLGGGRPFVLEMQDAKRILGEEDVAALQAKVNHRETGDDLLVQVLGLRVIGREASDAMKLGVESKRKRYRCVVWMERAATAEDMARLEVRDVAVQQRTPIRVLHRRASLVRGKVVYEMRAERMGGQWLYVDLITSSGAYVKEFVHGDRGRTTPSVTSMLGCSCECVQLDVMEVHGCAHTEERLDAGQHTS